MVDVHNQRFGPYTTWPYDAVNAGSGLGADGISVCAGATGAIEQALKAVERGGTILLFAPTMEGVTIPLSVNDLLWRRDVTLTTAYGGSPADCVHALELIRARRIPVADMMAMAIPDISLLPEAPVPVMEKRCGIEFIKSLRNFGIRRLVLDHCIRAGFGPLPVPP